jgi:hypothetical protein
MCICTAFFVYKKPANTVKQELDKSEREQF